MVEIRSRSCLQRAALMPITPFLGDISFDPETRRVMGLAFENGPRRARPERPYPPCQRSHRQADHRACQIGRAQSRSFVRSRAAGISPAAALAGRVLNAPSRRPHLLASALLAVSSDRVFLTSFC